MCCTSIVPFNKFCQEKWYLIFRYFVLGRIFGTFASSTVLALSSKILHLMVGFSTFLMTLYLDASFIKSINGRISRTEADKAIYSASLVESATSVCKREAHTCGHWAKVITYPIQDLVVEGSSAADYCFHLPAWEGFTWHSNKLPSGQIVMPFSLVPAKYLPIHLTASACEHLEQELNQAHWWTAYAISGLVNYLYDRAIMEALVKVLAISIFVQDHCFEPGSWSMIHIFLIQLQVLQDGVY